MTFQTVNFGAASDGSQGDAVRTGFTKMNANFALALEAAVAASTYIAKASDGGAVLLGKVYGVNSDNLQANGSLELGTSGWTFPASFGALIDTSGNSLFSAGNTAALSNAGGQLLAPKVMLAANNAPTISLSCDVANLASAGTVRLQLTAWTSADAYISDFYSSVVANGTAKTRLIYTGTIPASAAYIRANLYLSGVTAPASAISIGRIKIERGAPSLYSQESSVAQLISTDAQNVKLTGNQTIAGNKTFSGATTFANAPSYPTLAVAGAAYRSDATGKVLIYGFHSGGTFSNSGPVSFAAQVDQQTNWGNSNTFAPPVTAAYRVQASVMVSSAPAAGTSIELALVRGSDSVVMGRERFICTGAQFFNVRMDITLTLALGQGYFIQLAASASVTTSADTSYSRFAIEQVN
jgi:hypothetical protein